VVFALAIVLLFEPLRQRLQGPVDRFFFAERHRLQKAMVEMGEALTNEVEIGPVVTQLVERLPNLLGLHFAALYLPREGGLHRVAGPPELPNELPIIGILHDYLKQKGPLLRMDELAPIRLLSADVDRLGCELGAAGVEVVGLLATTRRSVGIILLSGKSGTAFEREELDVLRGLFNQASIALETNLLLDERARQAELERELGIAASIQSSLLPSRLEAGDGWELAAVCRPAREVGGDFYTQLPSGLADERALAYGDVSGKSISGALMMMAAHEVLNTLALAHPDPEELFRLANERLYILRGDRRTSLQPGSFVALGYLAFRSATGTLRYTLAGQPPPMVLREGRRIEVLRMPEHRLPLGALKLGGHTALEVEMEPGDLLLAYSDGVVEAQSPDGELFGEDRLASVLADSPSSSPEDAVDHVLAEIESFTCGHTPYDDLTLLAARRAGHQ
jgi:serine phosphatase RsbU (regulator of sigma subunit)